MKSVRLIIIFFVSVGLISCSKKNASLDKPIVATIGDYNLYVSDYLREVKKLTPSEKRALKTDVGKEAFLEQLIDQQVLLEEAQYLDIDEDEDFRLFVESFWKQAMIERLIIKKTKEVMKNLTISDEEIEFYFKEMQRSLNARIRVVGSEKVARKLLGNELLSYEETLEIQKDSGWNWFSYEEVHATYRTFLFGMEEGEKKIIYNYDMGWVFLEVKEIKTLQVTLNEELHKRLSDLLQEERDLEILDKWIRQLRAKTQIHVNKDVLVHIALLEK
jgi:hypothetical protein